MLNFSRGGVYLRCQSESFTSTLPNGYFSEQERQTLLLTVPSESMQLQISLVYCRNGGLGLAFLDVQGEQLFDALYTQHQRLETAAASQKQKAATPRPQPGYDATRSQHLLSQLQKKTQAFLRQRLHSFFIHSQEALQALIAETSDPQDESVLFFALNSLEQGRDALIERFIQLNASGFAQLEGELAGQGREVTGNEDSPELALVEKQEIDVWVLVNDMARRAESDVARNLYQVELGLSYLCREEIQNELDPVAPISLLTAFKKLLDDYDFDLRVVRQLLSVFRKFVLNELNQLYAELLQLLREQNMANLELELTDQWAVVKSSAPGARQASSIANLGALRHIKPSSADSSALDSMSVSEREEILSSLDSLSRLQTVDLQHQIETLLQHGGAKPIKLSPEARAAIGAGEELVATLGKDPLITTELKALLRSVKFLIIEAVLQDTSLLDNPDHPVRRLLDLVEFLKPYVNTGPHASMLRDRESRRLSAITEAVESGLLEHIEDVSKEINALLLEQRERFETNRKLAISRCLKDEKLRQGQRATIKALSKILLGKSVPLAIEKLLSFGWANLLVQTAVLEKVQSRGWRDYIQVVERLAGRSVDQVEESAVTRGQSEELVVMIHKGFTDYPIHGEEAHAFAEELHQALTGGEDVSGLLTKSIQIDEAYLANLIRDIRRTSETTADKEVDKQWKRVVDDIPLDAWLVEADDDTSPRVLSLAWKNPQTDRYLLVDGDGFKALDLELAEFARHFAGREIQLLEQPAQPVVERTIETFLSNSYDGLKQESAVDQLTGLSNRRAFEAELGKHVALADADSGEEPGVLLQVDLDRFQVVNDLCGFEGGDHLLRTITDILLSYLPDEAFLARTGDDEFSLLLRGYDLEQGYQASEMLRQGIDEYAFEWKGRMIPSSASVGIVQIGGAAQHPGELIQAALAACNMAKQGGGNCTRIFLESDSAYQDRQQLVQSLPAIKEALAKGRMELFAQSIVPLREGEGLTPHHEILLRVRNQAGELESPQDFIRAAELYDLMRAVDRWVVEDFYRLVEPLAGRLPEGVSFSINLSGKSTGDGEFKRFLTERISASPLPTKHLGFEITETALVGDISDTAAFIQQVRDLGCTFSLDDFGSGYASFSYLKDFPVDYVKIDGIFVREILNKPADYAMINSITEIAHFMDKRVIAEFVSGEDISQVLTSMGVDYGQGYYFGKPRPLKGLLAELTGSQSDTLSKRA
jgi:diguanylate cyclase (GGDEF)-like protein